VGCTRASVCGLTYAFSCKFATQSELGQIADRKVIEAGAAGEGDGFLGGAGGGVGVPEQPAVRAAGDEDGLHAAAHLRLGSAVQDGEGVRRHRRRQAVGRREPEDVGIRSARHPVPVEAADQRVRAVAAGQVVDAGLAAQDVRAGVAGDDVGTLVAGQLATDNTRLGGPTVVMSCSIPLPAASV